MLSSFETESAQVESRGRGWTKESNVKLSMARSGLRSAQRSKEAMAGSLTSADVMEYGFVSRPQAKLSPVHDA